MIIIVQRTGNMSKPMKRQIGELMIVAPWTSLDMNSEEIRKKKMNKGYE